MPEYLTPGVYMEEFEIGARPIEGVSTSTVGFLGITERGPTIQPLLVTSWTQFMRIYGGYTEDSYLPYAVEGFFNNGGKRCFISRVVRHAVEKVTIGAISANLKIDNVIFTAVGEGTWGNRIAVRIENSSIDPNNEAPQGKKSFKLTIAYWKKTYFPADFEYPKPNEIIDKDRKFRELLERADYLETFDDLSEDGTSPDYFGKKLGDPLNNLSNLIVMGGSGRPSNTEIKPMNSATIEPKPIEPATPETKPNGPANTEGNTENNTKSGKDNKSVFFRPLTGGFDAQKAGTTVDDEKCPFSLRDSQAKPWS